MCVFLVVWLGLFLFSFDRLWHPVFSLSRCGSQAEGVCVRALCACVRVLCEPKKQRGPKKGKKGEPSSLPRRRLGFLKHGRALVLPPSVPAIQLVPSDAPSPARPWRWQPSRPALPNRRVSRPASVPCAPPPPAGERPSWRHSRCVFDAPRTGRHTPGTSTPRPPRFLSVSRQTQPWACPRSIAG